MGSLPTLHDTLQTKFCPPLDSSLVAVIVDDFLSTKEHTAENINILQEQLSELAAAAETQLLDEDDLTEQTSQLRISSHSTTTADDSNSPDYFSRNCTTNSAATSATSDTSSQLSTGSPLAFLRSVFPCVPVNKLKRALGPMDLTDVEDMDMDSIIDYVLSNEFIRELEERGLDGLEDDGVGPPLDYAPWETVGRKRSGQAPPVQVKAKKSSNNRGTKIALIDVRQRQHARSTPNSPRTPAAPDPWTQLSSVASYLSTLLPPQPPSYLNFQSIFHVPDHPTPVHAVRTALRSLASTPKVPADSDPTPDETPQLSSLCEILFDQPQHQDLNAEARAQLVDDAKLALRAAKGSPDTALEIVGLLRELETQEWGVYHSPVPPPSSPAVKPSSPVTSSTASRVLRLPLHPPPAFRTPPPSPVPKSPTAWQTVPLRPPPSSPHPLAESIPAYAAAHARRTRGAGNGLGKGGKGDVGELSATAARHRRRAQQFLDRRREALKEAGRAWQQARGQKHGGDIALYYAERARELQQQAQKESLEGARAMVEATRSGSANGDTIDLHGTTVAEAVQIVKDILRAQGASVARPLKIITGRGNHSVNGIGVLSPAVKNALVEDGWLVGTWDAGLVVRGKTS
ncbi:hypothetical protein CERSUDRAFT_93203 [Gelatoporia subvermispora B]|uniref:Smr domain-containing protein n=1 Tax=Ceriporiopsis subvermispora (strain B) TaxID=914234 RepID=M2R3Q1_CERS8|nr:hypothetical protein CERSUDRAFT_93203 [Gelatoporia subvermispora B]